MPLLTLNSLLPSQSLFNEIQSIHETGFFHELDSFFCCKDGVPATPSSTQVNSSAGRMHENGNCRKRGRIPTFYIRA